MPMSSRLFAVAIGLAIVVHGFPSVDTVVPESELVEAPIPVAGCAADGQGLLDVYLPKGAALLKLTLAESCTVKTECTDIPSCKKFLEIGGGSCSGAQISISEPGWSYDNNAAISNLLMLPGGCMPCPNAKVSTSPNAAAIACFLTSKAFDPIISGLEKGYGATKQGLDTAVSVTGNAFKEFGDGIAGGVTTGADKVADGVTTGADEIARISDICGAGVAGISDTIASDVSGIADTVTSSLENFSVNIGGSVVNGILDVGNVIKSAFL
jgi:hypothetical protein